MRGALLSAELKPCSWWKCMCLPPGPESGGVCECVCVCAHRMPAHQWPFVVSWRSVGVGVCMWIRGEDNGVIFLRVGGVLEAC